MLKLTYTERSFCLECIPQSLEEWVTQRVIFAMRVGQNLYIEPTTASFLLPVDMPGVEALKVEVKRDDREVIALCICDSEYLEVTLQGSWLTNGAEDGIGVFITTMSDRTEFFLHKLWQEAQACASVMSE
jgi:hypothetical protein